MHSLNRADTGLKPRLVISVPPVATTADAFGVRRLGSRVIRIVSTSLLGAQDEHPFHVPGHGHKLPLAAHLIDPTQHELPEAHH